MFKLTVPRHVTAGALGIVVVLGAAACDAAATAGTGTSQTARPPSGAAVQALVADARAARDQHDVRSLHRIQARLVDLIGPAAARETQATYQQLLANLAAADAAHDARARARYRAELQALCRPDGLTAVLATCDAAAGRGR